MSWWDHEAPQEDAPAPPGGILVSGPVEPEGLCPYCGHSRFMNCWGVEGNALCGRCWQEFTAQVVGGRLIGIPARQPEPCRLELVIQPKPFTVVIQDGWGERPQPWTFDRPRYQVDEDPGGG